MPCNHSEFYTHFCENDQCKDSPFFCDDCYYVHQNHDKISLEVIEANLKATK